MSEKTLKIGIIGSGGIAQGQHIPGYQKVPGVEVIATCDVREETARAAADKFKIHHVFTDYKEMLRLKDIDAVSVCTPNAFHHDPTVAALSAGKHVLVEKPIAMNVKQGLSMCKTARKNKKHLAVGLHFRFEPHVLALKRMIDAGEVGFPYFARAQALRRRGVPSWGVFYSKKMNGGGPLIDIGVHILFATHYLMGMPRPISVSGKAFTLFGNRKDVVPGAWGQWNWKDYDVEDNAFGFVRFENGAVLSLESSFIANIPTDIFNLSIFGDKGGVQMEPCSYFGQSNNQLVTIQPNQLPKSEAHHAEIKAFCDAVRGNGRPGVTGEEALVITQMLDGIYASSEKGAEVKLDKLKF